jgi:hypothetical protein
MMWGWLRQPHIITNHNLIIHGRRGISSMAKPKYDVVVEAVRYSDAGQIDWVRAYIRNGPIFSDRIMIKRQEIIALLKAGKRVVTGKRIQHMAGTFNVGEQIRLVGNKGKDVLVSNGSTKDGDHLHSVPIL